MIQNKIIDYLDSVKLMQLATSIHEQPWVCNVWYAFDEQLNLYWHSKDFRRHSEEIDQNAQVAAAIVSPKMCQGFGQKVQGLQVQGSASRLTEIAELSKAVEIYFHRFPSNNKAEYISDIRDPENPMTMYILKPEMYVLFDEVSFPEDPRQEFSLK